MAEALLIIEGYQVWIYFLLAIAGLIYLRQTWHWYSQRRASMFQLERERASSRLARSAALLTLALALMLTTFVLATFAGPAVPASLRPTTLPTFSLLETPTLPGATGEANLTTATPLPTVSVDSSGCLNPLATLTAPKDGDSLTGTVEVDGTANIANFAFFKYEYISLTPGSVWRAVQAVTERRVNEKLGTWDTSLLIPGDYALRLVVTDAGGNAPLPCVIRVQILPTQ